LRIEETFDLEEEKETNAPVVPEERGRKKKKKNIKLGKVREKKIVRKKRKVEEEN